ncbi:MAG TPA: magnesium and cobalt transport protein CorA [Acidimicrobiales bacterium]|nr:magnesium and cobalt transport protein CorA [Acidimicrobiales bacterium]
MTVDDAAGSVEFSPGVVGDSAIYEDGRRCSGHLSVAEAAALSRTTSGFVWIGLRQPSERDIASVAREFDLPSLAVEDAVSAHQRPKLEIYDDVVFAVLKPVDYIDHTEIVEVSEVAIFIGRGFVVTVRHGPTAVLQNLRTELDAGSDFMSLGPSGVLYRIADRVVDQYEQTIDFINTDVDQIEAQVFANDDSDHVERIYKLKREISQFRRAVVPLLRPLERLTLGLVPGIDPDTSPYFRDVHDHVQRTAEAIETHDRLLNDVLQADIAMVALRQSVIFMRQNEDMRKISAWAAIALVPTAVAGVYGMNFTNMPELGWRYGYFIVLGVILGVCTLLYRLFRRNGWM